MWRIHPDRAALAGFLILCLTVQLLGESLTNLSVKDWYPTLVKPSWTPPSWVFAVVWPILYFLMAIAAWLVYKNSHGHTRVRALNLFFMQLLLNLSWSLMFFALRSPLLGLVNLSLLLIAIVATLVAFWRIQRVAGYLLLPYLMWVIYAFTLNLGIWLLN